MKAQSPLRGVSCRYWLQLEARRGLTMLAEPRKAAGFSVPGIMCVESVKGTGNAMTEFYSFLLSLTCQQP